eukprot:gene9200-biopygen5464
MHSFSFLLLPKFDWRHVARAAYMRVPHGLAPCPAAGNRRRVGKAAAGRGRVAGRPRLLFLLGRVVLLSLLGLGGSENGRATDAQRPCSAACSSWLAEATKGSPSWESLCFLQAQAGKSKSFVCPCVRPSVCPSVRNVSCEAFRTDGHTDGRTHEHTDDLPFLTWDCRKHKLFQLCEFCGLCQEPLHGKRTAPRTRQSEPPWAAQKAALAAGGWLRVVPELDTERVQAQVVGYGGKGKGKGGPPMWKGGKGHP